MKKEIRTAVYHSELPIEDYCFEEIVPSFKRCITECCKKIKKVCKFMEYHYYTEHLYLDPIFCYTSFSKAKKPLWQEIFLSDQSDFTNYFSSFLKPDFSVSYDIFCSKEREGEKNGK